MIRGTMPGMKPGTILGHEGVGVVEEVGAQVRNLKPGDRVVVPSTIACGSCSYCRAGYHAQCDTANPNGRQAGTALFGGPGTTGPFNGLQAEYRVPADKFSQLAEFDGSVVVERTAGEVSARCHDEQANFLALNLMHDIVTGAKNVQEARDYYAKEFADLRRNKPTPYMERLHFAPGGPDAADPDVRIRSDEDLQRAAEEGEKRA
jgi:hypothetical protein